MPTGIFNPKPSPKVEKEIDCSNCGARLAYTPADTRTFDRKDYTGDSSTYTVLDCPKCAHVITLRCL